MFILKTSLSLLLFFVFIIYFTIRKVNPLCEKIIYTRKKVGGRPTYPAESRLSLSGCILSHHQVTRFGISDSHGFARRKAPLLTMHYVYITFQAGRPLGRPLRTTNSFPIPHEPRATNYEPQKSTDGRPTSPAESRTSLSGLYTFTPSGHEIRHKRLTRFCASQSSFKTGSLLIPGNPGRIGSRSFPTSHESRITNHKKALA